MKSLEHIIRNIVEMDLSKSRLSSNIEDRRGKGSTEPSVKLQNRVPMAAEKPNTNVAGSEPTTELPSMGKETSDYMNRQLTPSERDKKREFRKSFSLEHAIRNVHEKAYYVETEDPNIDKVNQIADNLKKMVKKPEPKLPNINDGGPDMFKPGAKPLVKEDFEYEMARNELKTAIDAAKRLLQNLEGEGDIEAWVQSKITKASDYLDTVADYMDNRDNKKLKEETEEILEAIGIVGSQYKGNDFTQPVRIAPPGHSKEAHRNIVGPLRTAGSRRVEKQQTSLTMNNKITEGKKDEKEDGDNNYLDKLSNIGRGVLQSVMGGSEKTAEDLSDQQKASLEIAKKRSRDPRVREKLDDVQKKLEADRPRLSGEIEKELKTQEKEQEKSLSTPEGSTAKITTDIAQLGMAAKSGYNMFKYIKGSLFPKPVTTVSKPATGSTPKVEVPQVKPGEGSAKFPDIPTTKVDTKLEKVPAAANINNKGAKVEQPSAPKEPTQQMRTTQQEKPVEAKPEAKVKPETKKEIDITQPKVKTSIRFGNKQNLPGVEVKLPGGKKFAEPTPKAPAVNPANVNVPGSKPATTPAVTPGTVTPGAKPSTSPSPAQAPKPAQAKAPAEAPVKPEPAQAQAPKPAQAKAPAEKPVQSRPPKKGGKTGRSKRLRLPFALPSFGDATPYSGSPHSHTNPIYKHRAKKFSEETRKEIEATARPSNDKYRKNVGRFGKSELTRQSSIQKQIIDEQTKRRAKIVKDVILKNPNPQPEGMGQNSQVDVKPKLNHKFDNSPE